MTNTLRYIHVSGQSRTLAVTSCLGCVGLDGTCEHASLEYEYIYNNDFDVNGTGTGIHVKHEGRVQQQEGIIRSTFSAEHLSDYGRGAGCSSTEEITNMAAGKPLACCFIYHTIHS